MAARSLARGCATVRSPLEVPCFLLYEPPFLCSSLTHLDAAAADDDEEDDADADANKEEDQHGSGNANVHSRRKIHIQAQSKSTQSSLVYAK